MAMWCIDRKNGSERQTVLQAPSFGQGAPRVTVLRGVRCIHRSQASASLVASAAFQDKVRRQHRTKCVTREGSGQGRGRDM